ncbi:hypothetical protein [Modestobacter roseus]|uniref:hypothetical protein n=1 Tax=Modestobacter roseus TaxID=1181884 RepID=UPI001297D4C6|nr:hypothetical protein [Modestobacter roseus]MQA35927.1 hypothetical protein [Modestobacter roseus]
MTSTDVPAPGEWTLLFTTADDEVPEHFHPVLDGWVGHLREREKGAGIRVGTPILVAPDHRVDPRLVAFFNSLDFSGLALTSRQTYAYEYKWWSEFLERFHTTWDFATEADFAAYKVWRTDPTVHPPAQTRKDKRWVEGATWVKCVAALDRLYAWAEKKGYVEESPIPRSQVGRTAAPTAAVYSKNVRSNRTKWVSAATYRAWRDVGIRGYGLGVGGNGELKATTPDERFRGRNVQRNAAFTDLLFSSALRRQEGGSLLIDEVPEVGQESFVGAAAKRGKVRPWQAEPAALGNLADYINVTRRGAVRRAQKAGRYDSLNPIWIDHIAARSRYGVVLVTTDGAELSMKGLDIASRMRLMRYTDTDVYKGPEPLWLWLSEDGLPMAPDGWGSIFQRASKRFAQECERLGRDERDVLFLSPHSLRYSYALYVLVVLHQFMDRKYGYSPTDPYDERRYSPAYDIVRDLLGHSSTQTTRNHYLQPVLGLRGKAIVGARDAQAAIAALSLTNPEVRHLAPAEMLPDTLGPNE